MNQAPLFLLSTVLLSVAACGPVGPGAYVPGPVPTSAPVSTIKSGSATTLMPGAQAGYGITATAGGSYRAVWTGDAGASGSYREFQGSIYTTGTFLSVTPGCAGNQCALESSDYVGSPVTVPGGQRIDFDTFATTGLDGLDFVTSSDPVYFYLLIDGALYPGLVLFTSAATNAEASAPSMPFGLTIMP